MHVKLVDLSKAKKSLKSALKLSDDWSDEEQQVLVKKYKLGEYTSVLYLYGVFIITYNMYIKKF